MEEFKSTWWSIELLPTWSAEQEESCTSICSENDVGALQVSAYRKSDRSVSEKDLVELSEGQYPTGVSVDNFESSAFKGLQVSFSQTGKYWRKWWMHEGSLLLFITYTCNLEDQDVESEQVDQMIGTLKAKEPAG
jgi:hypothetical protein